MVGQDTESSGDSAPPLDIESDSSSDSAMEHNSDVEATCFDEVQNQDETRIDCGGVSCSPCPTCFDGIENQGELRIDCGGPCAMCAACTASFDAPREINGLGAEEGNLWSPHLSADNLTLYFAQSIDTNENIMVATRTDRGTTFSEGTALSELNSDDLDGTPFLHANRLNLYFFSTRAGGAGGRDLWRGTRENLSASFDTIQLVGGVNSDASEYLPFISMDEQMIYFVSDRAGGLGGTDIWQSQRTDVNGDFEAPVLTPGVNSDTRDSSPFLTPDGLTMYFISNRPEGLGTNDIWMVTRPNVTSDFSNATNVTNLNSPESETDVSLSLDEREIFFSSSRNGSYTLWRARRDCP